VKSRIYRWYGALIAIERSALSDHSAAERASLLQRLDAIEDSVNGLKMPLAYADQFYVLREHIGFVRARLTQSRDGRREMSEAFDTADDETEEAEAADIEARAADQADSADQAGKAGKAAETDAAPNEAAEIGETRADDRRKPD
jgi:hypothetical protein